MEASASCRCSRLRFYVEGTYLTITKLPPVC